MRKAMSGEDLGAILDVLITAWCARKELRPLRRILNGWAAINGLTDGWAGLLEELQAIRAQDRERITEDELDLVIELQQEMQNRVR
jgi:hypothetical protein